MLMTGCLQTVIVAGHHRTVSRHRERDGLPRLVGIVMPPAGAITFVDAANPRVPKRFGWCGGSGGGDAAGARGEY
jgi:hypothetical protein